MDDLLSKTLTTGGAGMTANYVDFGVKYDHASLDITNPDQVADICNKFRPKTILHLAAATNVDLCEKDKEYAYRVNTFGTYNLALAARSSGAKLIYVSTAGVFDGTKNEPYTDADFASAEPQNHYSKSKYLGEVAIRQLLSNYLIVRTGWLFGGGAKRDHKFVGKILRSILTDHKKKISAVADTKGTPTYCKDLVSTLKTAILTNIQGNFVLGNVGSATRYDIASHIVSVLQSGTEIEMVNSDTFKLTVKRTASEAILTSSQHFKLRTWQEALREYIDLEWLGR